MAELISTWGGYGSDCVCTEPPSTVGLPIKAIMGWGGIIVSDSSADMVDMTRAYAERMQAESCGQCFPCRMGTEKMVAILDRICRGQGSAADVDSLEDLAAYIWESSRCDIGKTSPKPIIDALKRYRDDFVAVAQGKRKVAQGKYVCQITAPCISACPDRVDIPGYVEKIRMEKLDEAIDIVRDTCCLPGTIGRVCVRACEFKCKRGNIDEPIAIKHLKRFAADKDAEKGAKPSTVKFKDKKVAIIGAGPAGLSCAYYLGRRGYRSTIFEALPEPGGMAAVGIPDYRLPRKVLRDEAGRVEAVGAEIKYNVKVGKDVKVKDLLEKEGYSAVFIGAGAPNSSAMGCEGEDAGYKGYMPGVEFLRAVALGEKPLKGKKMLVIGGGNVAMDCVRTARRLGYSSVSLLYRRTEKEMPADPVEIAESKEEGVEFITLVAPVKIHARAGKVTGLECMKMTLGEPDASGRRKPVPEKGSNFIIECDSIVPAIGQSCEIDLFVPEGVGVSEKKTLVVDPVTLKTSLPNIFGGGDCVTGPSTLVAALAAGRRAARSIIEYMETGESVPDARDWLDQAVTALSKEQHGEDAPFAVVTHRHHPPVAEPDERIADFSEVEGCLPPAEARREAARCLRCYRIVLGAL